MAFIRHNSVDIIYDSTTLFFFRLVSVSRRRAHIMAVVFHTLHRGLTNTTLCTYLVTFTMLNYL